MTGDKQKNEINLLFVHTQAHIHYINKAQQEQCKSVLCEKSVVYFKQFC